MVPSGSSIFVNGLSASLPSGFERLASNNGFTNGTCQFVFQFIPETSENIRQSFSPRAMANKGMQYIDEELLESAVGKCPAIRFQQTHEQEVWNKWAIFVPSEKGTHFLVTTFHPKLAITDQFSTIASVLGGISYSANPITASFRLCEFREVPPFKVAYFDGPQTILTVDGVFPIRQPSDLVFNLSELSLSLVPAQFVPFIEKRLDSLNAIRPSIEIRKIKGGIFDVTAAIQDQTKLQLAGRYLFLRTGVFLAEVIGGKTKLDEFRDAWEGTIRSIRLSK